MGFSPEMLLPKNQDTPLSGIICASVAYAALTLFDILLKYVNMSGYDQWQMMAVVGLFSALTALCLARCNGALHRQLATQRPKLHLLRGILGLIGLGSGFYAIRHIQLVDFYGVIFCFPVVTTLLARLWLKEPIGRHRWLSIGGGFIGVTIMLQMGMTPHASSAGTHLGYGAALVCALVGAVSTLLVRRYGQEESTLAFSFYSNLLMLLVMALLWLILGGKSFAFLDLLALAAAGILVGAAGSLLTRAFQRAPAATVTPFQYTQLLWGAVLSYAIFHDVPHMWSLVGAGIVIGSSCLALWREIRLPRTASLPT